VAGALGQKVDTAPADFKGKVQKACRPDPRFGRLNKEPEKKFPIFAREGRGRTEKPAPDATFVATGGF